MSYKQIVFGQACLPEELTRILSFTIESILDLGILRADREAEAQERRQITRAMPSVAYGTWRAE